MNPGARVGPHEVVALLGAGGEGEARGSRLAREVALEVPDQTLRDTVSKLRGRLK